MIFAEIVRAGVASLPRGQREAALAIGPDATARRCGIVLLPQAFRVMLPAIISQLVVVLKDTSLVDLRRPTTTSCSARASSIRRNLDNPIQTFFVVALIYIAINYALGRLAQYLQARQARRGRQAAPAETLAAENQVPVGGLGGGA